MECLQTKVNLEVQWASESVIAQVERLGGTITTAYFDIFSVKALSDPVKFFKGGNPIPRRLTPPGRTLFSFKKESDPKNIMNKIVKGSIFLKT